MGILGQRREDRQRLLSGMAFTIWHKWKRRCSAVNNRVKPSPFDTIRRLELAATEFASLSVVVGQRKTN